MPLYGTLQPTPGALWENGIGYSFNAEVIGSDGVAGERFALAPTRVGQLSGFSTEISWDAAPASGTITETQISDTDEDAFYVTKDSFTWDGVQRVRRYDPAGFTAKFVRVRVSTHDIGGHHITAKVCR